MNIDAESAFLFIFGVEVVALVAAARPPNVVNLLSRRITPRAYPLRGGI
jgi:hypothetical protein